MMHLTSTIDIFEVVWVAVAIFGLVYALALRAEANRDLIARHTAGINSGRQELAQLLVTTSSLTAFAFIVWLGCGLLLLTEPPVLAETALSYTVKIGIIAAEIAIALMQFIKQRVRRRVLLRDINSKHTREAAAALLESQERQRNTSALMANTSATEAATAAMQNGSVQAQTEATEDLITATNENTDVIKISTQVELKKHDNGVDDSG